MVLPIAIWTCDENKQTKARHVAGSTTIDPSDLFNQVGFRWLVLVFRFYGLRVDHGSKKANAKSAINLWTAGFIILVTSGMCLIAFVSLGATFFSTVVTIQQTCHFVGNVSIIACVPITYIHTCIRFQRCRQFLHDLALCVNSIFPASRRASCIAEIKKSVRMAGVFQIVCLVFIIVLSRFRAASYGSEEMSEWPVINALIAGIWFLFGWMFITFYLCFVLLSCKTLVLCFDCYIPRDQSTSAPQEPKISLGEQLLRHQSMSVLVKRANDVFSFYMIMTLITDISIIIVYCKFHGRPFAQERMLSDATSILVFFLYMTQLVLKIVYCSQLNEKVISSLELSVLPKTMSEMQDYTGEHINYILYQHQQTTHSATITFGGFFAVKKDFLFTVTGLIFSYALLLKGTDVE